MESEPRTRLYDAENSPIYNRKTGLHYFFSLTFLLFADKYSESDQNLSGNTLTNSYTTIGSQTSLAQNIATFIGIYKQKERAPHDLVKLIRYHLGKLNAAVAAGKDAKSIAKIATELGKPISALKTLTLQSKDDVQGGDYEIQMHLIKEVYEQDLLGLLVNDIEKFPFEARKESVVIFNSLLRRFIPPNKYIVVTYIKESRPELLTTLLCGYEKPENTLNYGLMLRECISFEPLAEIILACPEFDRLFDYIQLPTFDLSSDAFATFKALLTEHKALATTYMTAEYSRVFPKINALLASDNYVTRRQSLKLLGELLHDRRNYEVMIRYVSDVENLKLLMTQLRDKSEKIQYEAFQVFKIFIANPTKPKPIHEILCKNRDRILHFLESFNGSAKDDQCLMEDKMFLIEKLQQLPQLATKVRQSTSHESLEGTSPCSDSDLNLSGISGSHVSEVSLETESPAIKATQMPQIDSESFISVSLKE